MTARHRPSRPRPAIPTPVLFQGHNRAPRLWTLVVATLVVLLMALSLPAHGRTSTPPPEDDGDGVRLTVAAFTGVLGPGTVAPPDRAESVAQNRTLPSNDLRMRVLVENHGPDDLAALRVVTEFHPAVGSRSELRQALDGGLDTDPLHVHDPAVRDGGVLAPGEVAGIEERFTTEEVDWAEEGGVHPVRIAVTRGTEVLDELVTAVVWLARYPTRPVSTVFVWPLDEPPWRTSGGDYAAGAAQAVATGARLDGLVRVLEQAGPVPVHLAPAVHLLEDLDDRSRGFTTRERGEDGKFASMSVPATDERARRSSDVLDRIRNVAGALPSAPVTGPYAGADLAALDATGDPTLRELAGTAASTARPRLRRELGRVPDGAVHVLHEGVTPGVLDLVPGDQLLVAYDATSEPDAATNPDLAEPLRSLRSPAGRALTAMIADPYLSDYLSHPDPADGPVLAAQRLVATTAMVHFEAPSLPDRTLLLLPEPDWDPGIEIAGRVLEGLRAAPWLALESAGEAMADGRRAGAPVALATPGQLPPAFVEELRAASHELAAAQAALPEGAQLTTDRSVAELEDALARAGSRWLRSPGQTAADALVRDVRGIVEATLGDVDISDSSVMLTSDSGQVPVTLQRPRGGPITVQVEVASQSRLAWPEGRRSEQLVLDENGSTTVSFATEARSTGTFPVTVRVTDPSGTVELARTTLSVRSTAISGPALTGIGSVVLVLLLVGSLRRRHDPPGLELVTDGNGRVAGSEERYSS